MACEWLLQHSVIDVEILDFKHELGLKEDEKEFLKIDADIKGVVGDLCLTIVQRRDQLSWLVARRQILIKMIAICWPRVDQEQIVDVPFRLCKKSLWSQSVFQERSSRAGSPSKLSMCPCHES